MCFVDVCICMCGCLFGLQRVWLCVRASIDNCLCVLVLSCCLLAWYYVLIALWFRFVLFVVLRLRAFGCVIDCVCLGVCLHAFKCVCKFVCLSLLLFACFVCVIDYVCVC